MHMMCKFFHKLPKLQEKKNDDRPQWQLWTSKFHRWMQLLRLYYRADCVPRFISITVMIIMSLFQIATKKMEKTTEAWSAKPGRGSPARNGTSTRHTRPSKIALFFFLITFTQIRDISVSCVQNPLCILILKWINYTQNETQRQEDVVPPQCNVRKRMSLSHKHICFEKYIQLHTVVMLSETTS